MTQPKKLIPWQDVDRLGGPQAFVMSIVEALISPADYFEKLEIREFYSEPAALCFFNTLFLAAPIIFSQSSLVHFLAVIFILIFVPVAVLIIAIGQQYVSKGFGVQTEYWKNFHILAYSSPVFILAMVPIVGYGLAAVAFFVVASVGLVQVYKTNFYRILLPALLTPVLVLGPYAASRVTDRLQKIHPQINSEIEAQKVLAAISIAAENYALKNRGQYPVSSDVLVQGGFLKTNYCGQLINGYRFNCEMRDYGYFLRGSPSGRATWNEKIFTVTTGGKLWEK